MSPSNINLAYTKCRDVFKEHAKTYYLGAVLFDKSKFRHICAFYGFVRVIDNMIDCDNTLSVISKKEILLDMETLFFTFYNESKKTNNYYNMSYLPQFNVKNNKYFDLFIEILPAVLYSFNEIKISDLCLRSFFSSMRMDLEKLCYKNSKELEEYMYGSAEIIGEVMYLIMEEKEDINMIDYAYSLGKAFQLTNFIRDIREDYEMKPSRIYIPLNEQEEYNVNLEFDIPKIINGDINEKEFNNVKKLIKYQIDKTEKIYDFAQIGIEQLKDKEYINLSKVLYSSIHKKIIDNDYDVFSKRCHLSSWEKIKITYNLLSWYNIYRFILNYISYSYFF